MLRSTMRVHPAKLQSRLCKNKKNEFFLTRIRYNSQKCIIFAAKFKNGTKLQKIFNINKLNFKLW